MYTSYVVDFSRVLALMQWTSGVHPRGEEEEGRSKYWPSIRESSRAMHGQFVESLMNDA